MKKHHIIFSSYTVLAIVLSLIYLQAYNQHHGKETSFIFLFILWVFGLLLTLILFFTYFRLLVKIDKIEKPDSTIPQTSASSTVQNQYQEKINKDEVIVELLRTASTKKSLNEFSEELLRKMAQEFSIVQGVFYSFNKNEKKYTATSSYAFMREEKPKAFIAGNGINGQAVIDKEIKIINQIPEEYRIIISGLGESKPTNLYLIPLIHADNTLGLIEISTLKILSDNRLKILEQLVYEAGKLLNNYL
jgi:hypothetical protein